MPTLGEAKPIPNRESLPPLPSQRNKRRREQDEALDRARTLLDAGQLSDAMLILENAVETKVFAKSDPRFATLLEEVDAKKQQRQIEGAFRELRSLLAAGRHSEVMEKGQALLRAFPREVELYESELSLTFGTDLVAGKRSDRGSALRLGTSERFLGVPPRSTEYRSKGESLISQAATGVW
jgi:hypothetical protein